MIKSNADHRGLVCTPAALSSRSSEVLKGPQLVYAPPSKDEGTALLFAKVVYELDKLFRPLGVDCCAIIDISTGFPSAEGEASRGGRDRGRGDGTRRTPMTCIERLETRIGEELVDDGDVA